MTRELALLQRVRDVIAGTRPPTVIDSTSTFSFVDEGSPEERSAGATTRRFHLELPGAWTWTGLQSAVAAGRSVTVGVDVVITYRRPRSALAFMAVVLEDVGALYAALMSATSYAPSTTGVWQITTAAFGLDAGEQPNDTAVLTLPLSITYDPENL